MTLVYARDLFRCTGGMFPYIPPVIRVARG
jgi:hypothetical protein